MPAGNMVCIALRVRGVAHHLRDALKCLIPSILKSESSVTTIHTEPLGGSLEDSIDEY